MNTETVFISTIKQLLKTSPTSFTIAEYHGGVFLPGNVRESQLRTYQEYKSKYTEEGVCPVFCLLIL